MKWQAWSKWPLLGVTATAVALAAPSDDGGNGAEIADPGNQQQIASTQSYQSAPQAVMQGKQGLRAEQQTGRVELERLKQAKTETVEAEKTEVANAFTSTSWYVAPPPPPPPTPPPPAAPTAPPVPFTYFGRYEDPPTRIVMLSRGEQMYTVSEGDVIDGTYRIEHITDGSVALVYLPLGTNQIISTGAP